MAPIHDEPDELPIYLRYFKDQTLPVIYPDDSLEDMETWDELRVIFDVISDTLFTLCNHLEELNFSSDSILPAFFLPELAESKELERNEKFKRQIVSRYECFFRGLLEDEKKLLYILNAKNQT